MEKCLGISFEKWKFGEIFDIKCPNCGNMAEPFYRAHSPQIKVESVQSFKDKIKRSYP